MQKESTKIPSYTFSFQPNFLHLHEEMGDWRDWRKGEVARKEEKKRRKETRELGYKCPTKI